MSSTRHERTDHPKPIYISYVYLACGILEVAWAGNLQAHWVEFPACSPNSGIKIKPPCSPVPLTVNPLAL